MFKHNDTYFAMSPNRINIVESFKEHPDEILQILQMATNCTLTLEQSASAKKFALELANAKEINNILELV